MKNKYIGVDLGSSDLLIYIPSKGIVYNEPNIVAYDANSKKVIESGYLALKMAGKEQNNIHVTRPIENGTVSSISKQVLLFKHVLNQIKKPKLFIGSTVVVSVPSELNEVNILAIKKIFKDLGAEDVELLSQSYLALIGAESITTTSRGNMLVTIGGGCSDVVVTSGANILISKRSSFSGKILDTAITRHLRKKHQLIIGDKTSEYVKMKIGSLEPFPENRLLEVSGRDLVTALPKSVIISTMEVKQAIVPALSSLLETITDCLESINPEVSSDIIESGIIICGGGALLGGLRDYLESHLNITVRLSSEPTYAVINGIKNYIISNSKKK
jgi:rod shape-determining protein MreB